jgi:hypothetical protein
LNLADNALNTIPIGLLGFDCHDHIIAITSAANKHCSGGRRIGSIYESQFDHLRV